MNDKLAEENQRLRQENEALRLAERGIPTAVYYPTCLHEQPVFAPLGYHRGEFPVAERAAEEVLSLPMHADLDERTQDRIIAELEAVVAATAGE